jgi:hypothetical protein
MNPSMITVTQLHPLAQKSYCYFKFINMNSRRRSRLSYFHLNAISFNASLSCVVLAFQKTEFTPFNYFNQISYHFNEETLIMLLNEKMLYG